MAAKTTTRTTSKTCKSGKCQLAAVDEDEDCGCDDEEDDEEEQDDNSDLDECSTFAELKSKCEPVAGARAAWITWDGDTLRFTCSPPAGVEVFASLHATGEVLNAKVAREWWEYNEMIQALHIAAVGFSHEDPDSIAEMWADVAADGTSECFA